MRRITLRTLVATILISLFAGALMASPASAASMSISVSRTSVIGGESVRVSGALGTRIERPVRLQRRIGSSWATIQRAKSTARGRYAFTVRPAGTAGTRNVYRVLAPRVRINGRVRAAVATAARTVVVVAQTAALTGPGSVTVAKPFTMTATLRPVRPGRVTVLQRFAGGAWTEIKRGVQTAAGTTSFAVTLSSLGNQSLRAVAAASGGAPAKISNTVAVTVLPPALQRVSAAATGEQGNAISLDTQVSADGRFVAFSSVSSNLVADDTNTAEDVFVRDRVANTVERVTLKADGTQIAEGGSQSAISADGRYVAFVSTANLIGAPDVAADIFVKDRVTGALDLVTAPAPGMAATGSAGLASLSADGRYVAFLSSSTTLVPGDTNGKTDVFVRDRTAGTTERISVDNDGGQADGGSFNPTISADGQYVVYGSNATNIVVGDDNGTSDIFRWSRENHGSWRVSETNTGVSANGQSGSPTISADGRYVAFATDATNLTAADSNTFTDVLVWDGTDRSFDLASLTGAGTQVLTHTYPVSVSGDGRYVAFASDSGAFAPGDTNGVADVFLRDRQLDTLRWITDAADGTPSNAPVLRAKLSGDGHTLVFESEATNLVPGDTNGQRDIFARDLTR